MHYHIETERLILRPLLPEDYEAAFAWCGDPQVNKYMIYPLYHRAEDVKAWLKTIDHSNPDSYDGAIVLKETGMVIGGGGLTWHPEKNAWNIGYNLRADQWGHGYAVEAMQGLIDYIRTVRPVPAIEGEFAAANDRSRRVMEKLGMTYLRDSSYDKLDGSEHFISRVYRRDF